MNSILGGRCLIYPEYRQLNLLEIIKESKFSLGRTGNVLYESDYYMNFYSTFEDDKVIILDESYLTITKASFGADSIDTEEVDEMKIPLVWDEEKDYEERTGTFLFDSKHRVVLVSIIDNSSYSRDNVVHFLVYKISPANKLNLKNKISSCLEGNGVMNNIDYFGGYLIFTFEEPEKYIIKDDEREIEEEGGWKAYGYKYGSGLKKFDNLDLTYFGKLSLRKINYVGNGLFFCGCDEDEVVIVKFFPK